MNDPLPRPTKASLCDAPARAGKQAHGPPRPAPFARTLRLPLRAMRAAAGKTLVEVSDTLGSNQVEISRLERRPDMMLSTLRRYAEALDARCEVVFVFDETGQRIGLAAPDEPGER